MIVYNYTAYKARFEMPDGSSDNSPFYYSMDVGQVHYLSYCVEASGAAWDVGSPQHDWIRQVSL